MRKELFETGRTVDAAIDSACEKLGCSRENCEWEIIDLPKKSMLGLKNIPAKVRVSADIVGKEAEEPEKYVEKIRSPARDDVSDSGRKTRENLHKSAGSQTIGSDDITDKEKLAVSYLKEVITAADLKAEFTITREHEGCCVNITGEGLGVIIGRRGDVLDALQYLTGLVANRIEGDYLRITVDSGDYRLKRKHTLESLARKLADQVLKTNVSRTLEPMNPFERRVIHATVSQIDGVTSSSIGDEPNRRVIITSPTARPGSRLPSRRDGERSGYDRRPPKRFAEDRGDKRDKFAGRSRDNSGYPGKGPRSPRKVSAQPQEPPKRTPESETITGISFGKIDLE